MTRELFWLTLTFYLTGLLWVPYMLNRWQVRGIAAPWPIRPATTSRHAGVGDALDVRP